MIHRGTLTAFFNAATRRWRAGPARCGLAAAFSVAVAGRMYAAGPGPQAQTGAATLPNRVILKTVVTPVGTPVDPDHTQHWIGVASEAIPAGIGRLLKLAPGQGLLVAQVIAGSPAEQAHLQSGDLLFAIDGVALTSQHQLVEAANTLETDVATGQRRPRVVSLSYIRDGDRFVAQVLPGARPASMLVQGDTTGFSPATTQISSGMNHGYLLPGGRPMQVGPGVIIDLNGRGGARGGGTGGGSGFSTETWQQIITQGQTVVFSQRMDETGNQKMSMTVGEKRYDLDPAHLDKLPKDIQPLAQSLVKSQRLMTGPMIAATAPTEANAYSTAAAQYIQLLQSQIQAQERRIDELNGKLDQLMMQLNKPAAGAGDAGKAAGQH